MNRLRFALLPLLLAAMLSIRQHPLHAQAATAPEAPGKQAPAQAKQAKSAPAAQAKPVPLAPLDPAGLDKRILTEATTKSEIMTNLAYLSDIIGPRLTGSAALKRANEWTAERMMSYGLTNVHLEAWTIPVGWERGSAAARIVEPDNGRSLSIAAGGWSPSTNGKVVGDVVVFNARTTADLAAFKGKLKNAIVLPGPPPTVRPINEPTPPGMRDGPQRPRGNADVAGGPGGRDGQRPPIRNTPDAAAPPANRVRRGDQPGANPNAPAAPGRNGQASRPGGAQGGADRQAPRPDGAPGGPDGGLRRGGFEQFMTFRREMAEFLRFEGAALTVRDSGKPQGLLVTTGSWGRGQDRVNTGDPLPQVFMAHEHYSLLYRLATRPGSAKTRVEVDITNRFIPGPIAVYNTVGDLRGSEKPEEMVILGAHLDSWDLAQGTTDNGTGSCIVLEAARILSRAGVRPKRTIRFVLFTGEEQGLHGSAEYVKQHKDELGRISMALVHDTGTGKVNGIGLQGRAKLKPILEAELASLKDIGLTDINTRSMGGSDHQSFEREGVPGFAVQQDMSEYRLTHHTQTDTLDKANEGNLIQGAQIMAVSAMRVANMPTLLPRER